MSEFFRGWRRKTGVMTLLLALSFMGVWIRSLRTSDSMVVAMGEISLEFQSKSGLLEFMLHRLSGSEPFFFGIEETRWDSEELFPLLSETEPRYITTIEDTAGLMEEWRYQRKTELCGLMFASGDQIYGPDRVETNLIAFPYGFLVVPLTLLSAYLLIGKPRVRKSADVISPKAEIVDRSDTHECHPFYSCGVSHVRGSHGRRQ